MHIAEDRTRWLARTICPHEPALRHWLERRRVVGCEVDDIIQEAYAKLVTLPSVAHIDNPRAYFFRTAFTLLIDEVRRARIVPIDAVSEIERIEVQSLQPTPDVEAESRQELRLVAEAIARLPPRCREAFVLRKVHGLSQQQTAERLGIAESTVEKHMAAGFRHLLSHFSYRGKERHRTSHQDMPEARHHDATRNER